MSRYKVLVVDDDQGARFGIRDFLEQKDFDVEEADSFAAAVEKFRTTQPDVAIVDYRLPDGNALDLLPRLKAISAAVPILILTGHGTIDLAVQAIKEGAEQFLTKPVELPTLLVLLKRLIENQRVRRRSLAGQSSQARETVDPFAGESDIIKQLAEQTRRVLATDSPILIQGETGAGKGVLARWIHNNSPRADEAFVDLNCAGLAREFLETELFGHEKGAFTGAVAAKIGLMEVADRGTVFLDEIGDVDPQLQPRLLKVLEEKQFRRLGDVRDRRVNIRLLAATHQDLTRLVREGRFRSDLYYRINAIPLSVPPLRRRVVDIPILTRHFLAGFGAGLRRGEIAVSEDAMAALTAYPWPGNIRELRNVLERAVLLSEGSLLSRRNLHFQAPVGSPGAIDSSLTLEEVERQHIERVLIEERGRVESAAQRLGIPRSSLYSKIKRFNINLSRF